MIQTINSTMKIQFRHTRVFTFLLTLLLLAGVATPAWAATVTYHVLTLPMSSTVYNIKSEYNGKRLEAIQVKVDNATSIELPVQFKSPLATNFKYYKADQVTKSATAEDLYDNGSNKAYIYELKATPTATPEGDPVTSNIDIYVTYDYKYAASETENTIAKLNGSANYNIAVNKGFLAYNKGRNNRPAVVPRNMVTAEQLTSASFVKLNVSGSGITTYWSSGDNKNDRADNESKFHFLFNFVGQDPYNIIIRTAYAGDSVYIEKNDDDKKFVYKYYRGGSLFAVSTNNNYIASDDHILYTKVYTDGTSPKQAVPTSESKPGRFHGQAAPIWGSFALLNNTREDGYIFMASRTNNADGSFNGPAGSKNNYSYNFLKFDNANLTINKLTPANATASYSTDKKLYEVKTVYFKVKTPFYALATTDLEREAHTVSGSAVTMSEFKIDNNTIDAKDIPNDLRRKYCNFTTFRNSDGNVITKYSQIKSDGIIFVDYEVAASIPFKGITPKSTYIAADFTGASWYELTDEGSTEENGKKLVYDGSSNFKNNGASGSYEKTSEFAFIGDPYELRVILRSATSGATPAYVGATGTPGSPTNLSVITTIPTAGYKWEIPYDSPTGSFLLKLYKGEGTWNWTATNQSQAVTYGTDCPVSITSNAQTITFNVSGLTVADGNYIKVTKGDTADDAQILSTTPTLNTGKGGVTSTGTGTVTATIAANTTGSSKTFTLTITEYNSSDAVVRTASVITITQETTAYTGNTVEYSTASSTRVKVLNLPQRNYVFHIVDKSGRIAAKASASEDIYTGLSVASIPSIIVSPFIVDETLTFYKTYTSPSNSRTLLADPITETPNVENQDIYVKYTTTKLDKKPIMLSENQQFNVRLHDEYLYYDAENNCIKSKASPTDDEKKKDAYLWKLRNRDPYAMLIDNLGARADMGGVSGSTSITVYDDNGGTSSASRENGAWVWLNGAALPATGEGTALAFTTTRASAQQFIAKASTAGGVYEVMVAAGDGVDASTTYYNIGLSATDVIKVYNNTTYAHGDDVLRFRLEQTTGYTYHLIDKAKHKLLEVKTNSPELILPSEYQSPLVAAYHYYARNDINIDGDVYTVVTEPAPSPLSSLADLYAQFETNNSDESEYTTHSSSLTANDDADLTSKARELTVNGDYYYKIGTAEPYTYKKVTVSRGYRGTDIFVTYEKNDLVNYNDNASPYLLKFLQPHSYFLEDGNDKLTDERIDAIYPYTNGDGNLNVYGAKMNKEQMEGGANTRPRWVWFFESKNSDPYHVKIHSRSTISYNGISHPTYLQTSSVHFNQDASPSTKHIVTGGALPTIASIEPTEYMVLGTEGRYKLMTTQEIDGSRRTVTSLEQYWKTYNMLKLEVLRIEKSTNSFDGPETMPTDKWSDLKTKLGTKGVNNPSDPNYIDGCNWHSYNAYANATRWNGYNDKSDGEEKKVVEQQEHWFQTFDMGDGYFDIVGANIPPVLILLDRHGWEIMRLPLPTTTYPEGDDELNALRAYDSPLVKEYKFYSNATKASGCHKYSIRLNDSKEERDQIKVDGKHFTSKSLAVLPPLEASGVKSNGVLNDQYVTYTVKEEYEKSYTYNLELNEAASTYTESGTASKFLVVLDGRYTRYVKNGEKDSYISKPIIEATNPNGGNVYDMILSPSTTGYSEGYHAPDYNNDGIIDDVHLWYVEPNLDIDDEMGIKWGTSNDTTKAEPLSRFGTRKKYKGKTGFDPYNLQIKNVSDSRYLTIDLSSATLTNGIWEGTLSAPGVYAAAKTVSGYVTPEGYDHTTLKITKQTFMAVSDANGNMQLMPRFDHTKRINLEGSSPWYTTLAEPENHAKASVDNNASMGAQTVFFVRPQKIDYRIIDNEGNEALRYQRAGDYYPEITEHFKSPLATDFKYYKTAPSYDGSTKTLTVSDEITGSLAGSGLNSDNPTVYVRYSYNENYDKDNDKILQGKWFTIDLAGKNVQSTETTINSTGDNVLLYSGTKPGTVNADDETRKWQWKFLVAPIDPTSEYHESPDPYAIKLFNRKANYSTDLSPSSPMSIPVKVNTRNSFSLLSHPDGGYALAVNGLGTYSYHFLNGASMTTPSTTAATTANEAGFTYKANTISAGAKLVVNDDVTHNYTYNVINGKKIIAVTGSQTYAEAEGNDFAPYLPDDAQTPLLDADKDYEYYGSVSGTSGTYAVVDMTKLFTLHGLYDDVVYVTYKAYGEKEARPFMVPNQKSVDGGKVIPGPTSQDASMNIKGELPYNIVWEPDNMMKANGSAVESDAGHELSGNTEHIWYFEGDDPYALQIKNKGGKYVNGSDLVALVDKASAPDFMLLKKSDYDYGILQVAGTTGDAAQRLTGYGGSLTANASIAPTKFIIFGLSVHDLIYHLIINNINQHTEIPYRSGKEGDYTSESTISATDTLMIKGTSFRDLTSGSPAGATYQLGTTQTWGGASHTYSHHVGAVSIGDVLQVPSVFYRPNCSWDYYIEGIYSTDGATSETDLNNKYKGLKLTNLMSDEDLINKTVVVNIVYSFNKDLTTNSGLDFVRSTGQNLWYTMETNDAGDPWLARYTKTQGLTAIAGRETHYTNDYLFTPVGDVYGFKMYNRYTVKNGNESSGNDLTKVMTTASLADNVPVTVDVPSSGYEVYELIEGDVPGYFRIHPVVNYTGTQYYIKRNGSSLQLSTTSQDWTFGLDMAMLQPYYLGAGNVGGLNAAGKTAYKNEIDKGEGKYKITDLQNIVYNDANIVHFTSGYYRLHSQPGITGISPVRYASGYLHDIEKTAGTSSTPIPLHFYSKAGVTTTFGDSGLKSGYTKTDATQGDIPVPATENDPSTIFYVTGSNLTNNTLSNVTMSTQDLNVIGNKMGTGTATTYRLIDIGGGIVVLLEPTSGNYLTFDQNETNKYDLHYKSTFRIDDVKWCMVPADSLMVTTNNGGDGYYYSTLYLPYDVLLPADAGGKTYNAYVCKKWYNEGVNPVPVPAVTGTPSYAEGKLVPAGTPVIIRTNDESGNMKLTLPNTTASTALPCVFTGTYLEKLLAADASHKVYTLGLPYTSDMDLDSGTGDVTAPLPVQSTTGVGFYINANPYKEASEMQSGWTRNNRYVLHNKIYYRAGATPGAPALQQRAPEFVPVIFGDEEQQEMNPDGTMEMVGDGCIYDLMGRKVASREQVEDGSWWNQATPGVYILNGRKVIKK